MSVAGRMIVLLVIIVSPFVAPSSQSATKQVDQAIADSTQATKDETKHGHDDDLGRDTPHGTLLGFLQYVQSGKYREAAQYLQLPKMERESDGERLARELHEVMDQTFVGRIGAVSHNPEGSSQAGVPQSRERIGVFRIDDTDTNVDLTHVYDATTGKEVWLFSSDTLAHVPDIFKRIEEKKTIESELPRFLVTDRFLSTPLWRWIAFVLFAPVAFVFSWAITGLIRGGLRIWLRWRPRPVLQDLRDCIKAPAQLVFTVLVHWIGVVFFLGLPLLIREYYGRFAGVALAASLAWLIFRLINRWAERARASALAGSGYRSGSIILLGQRILGLLVLIAAVLVMLSILGFNLTTAVAGLGIGSVIVAFAAQKTLENLIGGISILSDQVIRVGERCRIGDEVGTVEDISLRSTRIRTLNSTELSVPNGQLANMNVENLSRYNKSSFRTTLRLQRNTSPDQLRSFLTRVRILLRNDPRVDPEVARVRLTGFGKSSIEVGIYCHILTGDLNEFFAIREDLLLQIMDLITEAGTELAVPSRALHLAQDQRSGERTSPTPEQNFFKRRQGS